MGKFEWSDTSETDIKHPWVAAIAPKYTRASGHPKELFSRLLAPIDPSFPFR